MPSRAVLLSRTPNVRVSKSLKEENTLQASPFPSQIANAPKGRGVRPGAKDENAKLQEVLFDWLLHSPKACPYCSTQMYLESPQKKEVRCSGGSSWQFPVPF